MSSDLSEQAPAEEPELIGAADIVAAFTALRHDLKLQVRAGRELTSGLDGLLDACLHRHLAAVTERLSRLETACGTASASPAPRAGATGAETARPLATALAEIEESLERTVTTIAAEADAISNSAVEDPAWAPDDPELQDLDDAWEACLNAAPWLVRKLAAGLVGRLRQLCDERIQQAADLGARRGGVAEEALAMAATALADAGQGLELVLLRTRRLMEQAGLRRIDVLHEPFDADRMRAIETLEEPTIPEGHVARQFRPGYLLHGTVLRPAEVGVSR
jgi:hypothetical protein